MIKILVHAINGIGLGHLVRTTEIAKCIIGKRDDIDIVFMTNSRFPEYITKSGFKIYQLESDTRSVSEGKIDYNRHLIDNYLQIKKIIEKEKPDAVLFDSEYNSQIIEYCYHKLIKTIFVLRKTTDEFFKNISNHYSIKMLDLLIVPHDKNELSSSHISFLCNLDGGCDCRTKVIFTGPIIKMPTVRTDDTSKEMENSDYNCRSKKIDPESESNTINVLVTFAGGSDIKENKILYDKVDDLISQIKSISRDIENNTNKPKIKLNIIIGPFFRKQRLKNLEFIDDSCDIDMIDFSYDFSLYLEKSDIVISPAGYNTVNEILFHKVPSILVPLKRSGDDQFERAQRLNDMGCIRISNDDLISDILKVNDSLDIMRQNFPDISCGNTLAADAILNLLNSKICILTSHWLPVDSRFIYDELSNIDRYTPFVISPKNEQNHNSIRSFFNHIFSDLLSENYPFLAKSMMAKYAEYMSFCNSLIDSFNPKIIHAQFLTDVLFHMDIMNKHPDIPLVASARGYDLYTIDEKFLKIVFEKSSIILARSERMKQDMIDFGCREDKIVVHHSGINVQKYFEKEYRYKDGINMIYVGRLVEKKNPLFCIDIFDRLISDLRSSKNKSLADSLCLTMVGVGVLKDNLIIRINKSPNKNMIRYLGELSNSETMEHIKSSDILVHFAKKAKNGDMEGIPNVLMEAMSVGTLVVASNSGSIFELVIDNHTGLIAKEDDIDSSVKVLKYAIENLDHLCNLRKNAYRLVDSEFNIVHQTKKLEQIYKHILDP